MIKKIFLYNLSLLPLYIVYYIKLVDIKIFKNLNNTLSYLFYQKSTIFLLLIIVVLFGLWIFNRDLKSKSKSLPIIRDIKRKDYDYFTFLSVFILPLFGLYLCDLKDWIILFLILFFMGIIYIRGNFLYLNPIFLLFGWYLYEGMTNKDSKIIFLSDDDELSNKVEKGYLYKIIDKNFVFLKKGKNGK